MVLWEIALGTAYFLGLKRTYRHTLRIQRNIITTPNNHSNIGQFVHRRTRAVFDVAVKVHQNIQERDVQVGRNLGNFILQWLHQMKLSAQIRGGLLTGGASSSARMTKLAAGSGTSIHKTPSYFGLFKRGSNKNLLTSSSRGTTTHCRHLSIYAPDVPDQTVK